MEFSVLGSFSVVQDGVPVEITSNQARALLAILLVSPGQRASHEEIARRLWPTGGWSAGNVRACCNKLRGAVPGVMADRNTRGYCRVDVRRGDVDYLRFQDGVERAKHQRGAERVETLGAALDEWHGEPLGDLPDGDLTQDRQRLYGEWRDATSEWLRAMLRIGDAWGFQQGLDAALRRWPDDQALQALEWETSSTDGNGYQSSAEPGAGFASGGEGLEGYPELSRRAAEVYRQLSAGSNVAKRATGSSGRPARATPQQLPAHPPGLVGRDPHLAVLSEVLVAGGGPRARAVVLSGMPGVGKTQLALTWAESERDKFPDGMLHADLNGFASTPPLEPEQVLARLLDDLGVEPRSPTLDAMIATYRSCLAERKVLVVLDNAADAGQVRPLLPGPGFSAAIVVSRHEMDSLVIREGAHSLRLGPLDHGEARTVLTEGLDERRRRDTGPLLDDLVHLCGGLPLALSVIAARMRTRPSEPPWNIVRELRAEEHRLDALDHETPDLNVRAAFATSYGRLPAAAVRMFRLLAIHPGPTVTLAALVALADDEPRSVERAVRELCVASLLEEPAYRRFALHDLLRSYAEEQAATLTEAEHAGANDRLFAFLVRNAWACDQVIAPGRAVPVEEAGGTVVTPSSPDEAMEWLDAEYATVMASLQRAEQLGRARDVWLLAMVLVTFQWRRNRYADAERNLRLAAAAAERVATPADQAMVYRMLAGTYRGSGKLRLAEANLRSAIRLSEEAVDTLGVAHGRHGLAVVQEELGEPAAAAEQYEFALAAFRELGDVLGVAGALNGLGCVRLDLGEYAEALRYCDEARRLFDTTKDVNGQANAVANVGRSHAAVGDHAAAVSSLSAAADKYRDLRYARNEAMVLVELADSLAALSRTTEAEAALRRAFSLLHEIGDDTAAHNVATRFAMLE